jgi:hypothetical protein
VTVIVEGMRKYVADVLLDITRGALIASHGGPCSGCPHCDYPYKTVYGWTERSPTGGYCTIGCFECIRCGAVHTLAEAWGDWP